LPWIISPLLQHVVHLSSTVFFSFLFSFCDEWFVLYILALGIKMLKAS